MLKKILLAIVSIAVLVILMVYLAGGFRERVEPGRANAPVRRLAEGQAVEVAHQIAGIEWVEFVGALRAERRADVAAKIQATILEIRAQAGDSVEAGQELIRLDDRELQAKLGEARQAALAAEEALKNAEKDYKRFKDMLEQGVASRQDFDRMESAWKIAQAQEARARENVKAAETMLSYTVIPAPFAGKIVDKYAQAGDLTAPGRPLLTIYDPGALRLEAAVPEALAAGLTVGETLEVRLETLRQNVEGVIEEIVPQSEAASRTVLVKVRLPELPGSYEGMFGRLRVPSRERVRFCIPQSAIREVGQLAFVDVVRDDGTLERRQVQLGEHSNLGRVEVLAGVEAGERVALYGPPPPPLPEDVPLFPGRAGQ